MFADFLIFRQINMKSSSKLIYNNDINVTYSLNLRCDLLHLASYSMIRASSLNIESNRIEIDGGAEISVTPWPENQVASNPTTEHTFNVTGECAERRAHSNSYGVYYDVVDLGEPQQNYSVASGLITIRTHEYLHLDGQLSAKG